MSKQNKKKKRKRKVKASADVFKQMISPTKEFEFVNPDDEDHSVVATARRLSPGHLMELDSTSLIRAYALGNKKRDETALSEEGLTDEEKEKARQKREVEQFEEIVSNIRHSAEITSMALIDPETEERIMTPDECMYYLLPEWNTEVSRWAIGGARPIKEGEDADDVDRFPDGGKGTDETAVTGTEEDTSEQNEGDNNILRHSETVEGSAV